MLRLVTCIAGLIMLAGPGVNAQADAWEHLGERTVNFRAESDTIHVGRDDGRFTALKLEVRGGDVRFLDLKVHFHNGETIDVPIRSVIPAGGETRVIDLPGNRRVIRNVTFFYKTRPGAPHRATVHLWGRH